MAIGEAYRFAAIGAIRLLFHCREDAKYCSFRVCIAYLKTTLENHEIFCTCYMWPWFGAP